ncbi:MAG: hypothetical protein IH851_06720 [Armatimonadetes bacterium]|nr:hypothetical protein [Armatimonadota bacterium]
MVSILSAFILAVAGATPQANPIQGPTLRDAILTENEGFLLLPAEVVCAPRVETAVWSPDGRYVLSVCTDDQMRPEFMEQVLSGKRPGPDVPPGFVSLNLWSAQTRRTKEIWKAPIAGTYVGTPAWLPGSDVALVSATLSSRDPISGEQRSRDVLFRMTAGTGHIEPVAEVRQDAAGRQYFMVSVSPNKPYAVLLRVQTFDSGMIEIESPRGATRMWQRRMGWLSVVRPAGAPEGSVQVPIEFLSAYVLWQEDGTPYVRCTTAPASPSEPTVARFFSFDVKTGALTQLQEEPKRFAAEAADHPLRLRTLSVTTVLQGTSRAVTQLWLESPTQSEMQRALVCADAGYDREQQAGRLSPKVDGVLYLSQGAAFVKPLVRTSREALLEAARKTEISRIVSNAKQVAQALHIYTADNDDTYPDPGEDIVGLLFPYLKMESAFEGFVYTFSGGPARDIQNPSTTVMGYIPGPGGRAVMYADTHVRWIGN